MPKTHNQIAIWVEPYMPLMESLSAYLNGEPTSIPEDRLQLTLGWGQHVLSAPPGKVPQCPTCGVEASVGQITFLMFTRSADETTVDFLCAFCGTGKSRAEIVRIAADCYRVRHGVEPVGPSGPATGRRLH